MIFLSREHFLNRVLGVSRLMYLCQMRRMLIFILLIQLFNQSETWGQGNTKIAKLKYQGGGDWYANKTALPNLIKFCNRELNMM